MDNYDYLYKVLIIGDSSVGKTSMILKMLDGVFDPSFMATIGIDYRTKLINVSDKIVKVQLWDTAGQERFRSIVKTYFRAAMGILLCFDVSDKETFNNLNDWYTLVQDYCLENVSVIVIGNKTDLLNRQVTHEEGFVYATSINAKYIELSTKNDDIQYILNELSKNIMEDDSMFTINKNKIVEIDNHRKCCNLM
jgi:small GTP-binding protein